MIPSERFPESITSFIDWVNAIPPDDISVRWAVWSYLNNLASLLTATLDYRFDSFGEYLFKSQKSHKNEMIDIIIDFLSGDQEEVTEDSLRQRYEEVYGNRLKSLSIDEPHIAPHVLPVLLWIMRESKKTKAEVKKAYTEIGTLMAIVTATIPRED